MIFTNFSFFSYSFLQPFILLFCQLFIIIADCIFLFLLRIAFHLIAFSLLFVQQVIYLLLALYVQHLLFAFTIFLILQPFPNSFFQVIFISFLHPFFIFPPMLSYVFNIFFLPLLFFPIVLYQLFIEIYLQFLQFYSICHSFLFLFFHLFFLLFHYSISLIFYPLLFLSQHLLFTLFNLNHII